MKNLLRAAPLCHSVMMASSQQVAVLPKYPVPPLSKTLDRYLKSVKPFLSSEEMRKTEDVVKHFGRPGGVGDLLQEKLHERAAKVDNWLEEWWINTAYLEYRDPVVVFSNPGLVFPPRKFGDLNDQLTTAAKLTTAALSYKKLVDENQIPVEMAGKSPLDMAQYHKIFGTVRQPWKPRDRVLFNPDSGHIVVAFKNNFYKLQVVENGKIIKIPVIFEALKKIACDKVDSGPAIGILTSENRDAWADVYAELTKDPLNACTVQDIENSLFVLCLDGTNPTQCMKNEMDATSANLVHGGGLSVNSSNRWFDKTIQFVVGKESGWGLNYEHSPAEGQAIARMMDHIVKNLERDPGCSSLSVIEPVKLTFRLNDNIEKAIQKAASNLQKLVDDLEFNPFHFKEFGKNAIKQLRVSPDSFIQIAIQYAFFRLHHSPGAQYETGSTRAFIGGRTETIRSCSEESVSFAKAMLDNNIPTKFKAKALLLAITAHKDCTLMAMSGQGVDRHLLGLRKIAAQEGVTDGLEMFQDVGWTRSTHMRVSTSQVAAQCDGFMIYGPLVHDGYACCYNPQDDAMLFGTTAWRSCQETNLQRFGEALKESLKEMRSLLEKNPSAKL